MLVLRVPQASGAIGRVQGEGKWVDAGGEGLWEDWTRSFCSVYEASVGYREAQSPPVFSEGEFLALVLVPPLPVQCHPAAAREEAVVAHPGTAWWNG